ncbi:MAG: GTP cyclohydrolase I FolE [Acidobacteria bacterium]|nr:GTP cyclohydrolase I FolE [Acidobacteriota bacterium]
MPNKLSSSEIEMPIETAEAEGMLQKIIHYLGEDPDREGLRETPKRIVESLRFLTSGYRTDPMGLIRPALFDVSYNEMVIIKDIEVFSLCEHHLLPFYGKCHVAYIPNGQVIGLSKIPRVVDAFARRLQIQERLTVQIAETIADAIHPKGVGVVVEAVHLCIIMRGVEKQHSVAVTSSMLGTFKEHIETRNEFLSLIRQARG